MVESWKQELDKKYEELTSTGDIKKIDRANEVILEAIDELDRIAKGEKLVFANIIDEYPYLWDYDYKWKDSENYQDLNEALRLLGYKLVDGDVKAGDYNDPKGYLTCEIERIKHE